MTGVLLDLRTGDPILKDGDFVPVEDKYAFYQIIDNLLNCQYGSEPFNTEYGFDLRTAIIMSGDGASVMLVESLLASALDQNKERLISQIHTIKCEREGTTMKATIHVESIFGSYIELIEGIGE